MANALSGTAGSVAYITGGTTAVGSIKEWSLSLTHNPVETTAFADVWQTYIASIRGATGSFSGNGDINDSAHTSLRNAMIGGSAVALRFYNGPDYYWEAGTAYLTGNERSISNDGKLELSYDFTVSGAIIYNSLWLHNGTWSVGIDSLSNSPTLGSEILTNGNFETWTSATNAGTWAESLTGTSTVNQETSVVNSGSNACRLDVDGSASDVFVSQTTGSTIGAWYLFSYYVKSNPTGKQIKTFLGAVSGQTRTITTTYTQYSESYRAVGSNASIGIERAGSASSSLYVDDASFKLLTLNTLFTVKQGSANPSTVGAGCTIGSAGCHGGVVYGLDSYTAPTTFILAIHDGVSTLQMLKCVSGTYTSLVSATVTHVAGARIQIVFTGSNTYQLWYNGTQRGTDQTVSDAGTGIYHGAFSTNASNTISGFVIT